MDLTARHKSPCKNCQDRVPGCHSKCKKYLDYRVELETKAELDFNAKENGRYFYERNQRIRGTVSQKDRF